MFDHDKEDRRSEFDPVMLGHAKAKDVAPIVDQTLARFLRRLHRHLLGLTAGALKG